GFRSDYHFSHFSIFSPNECRSTVPSIHLRNPMFTGNSGNVNSVTFNLFEESASKRKKDDDHEKIYKFETDLRQQKYKVIGNVEGVDSILACALDWDSFEQIYLFNLIGSEYGNDFN
ncbi:14324_t:CDS:2, partial [Dentiscutata erythropus]